MLSITIRADASDKVGTGHVMRCLALCEAFPKDAKVTFLAHSILPHLEYRILSEGHTLQRIKTFDDLPTQKTDLLIVDHYGLSSEWENEARSFAKKILALDDFPKRHHSVDFLLDQNFHRDNRRYQDFIPKNCQTLLGPQYALLRREILEHSPGRSREFGDLKKILIAMGGTDPSGETLKVLKALSSMKENSCEIHIVTTGSNPHLSLLQETVAQTTSATLHVDSAHYVSLMNSCDLAIAAGGSSTWERLYLGLPSIQVAIFENQLDITKELSHSQIVRSLSHVDERTLRQAIREMEPPGVRRNFSERGMSLVDGKGAERVFSALV